jgi:sugar phosphate permease
VLTPALTAELSMTKAELSAASGAWFAAFALAQFAVGISLDRYGPKRTASVMLALGGGGGALLFATATAPAAIIASMALIGIGCAPVLISSVFIFAHDYKPARLAILISWLVAFGSAGNVIGAAPLAVAAEALGWRSVLVGLAAATLLVALALALFVRDPQPQGGRPRGLGLAGYGELLRIRNLWLIAPLVAFNYAPVVGVRGLWSGPYLSEIFGADALAIGRVTLFMALAMIAGAFLWGPLDTLFGTRKWVAVAGNLVSMAAIAALALDPEPGLTRVTVIFVMMGVFGGGYGLLMAHGRSFVPPHLTGRGVTLLNFFSIGGVSVAQFATGAVYSAASVAGEPASGYQAVFGFYAALVAFAIAIYLMAPDARPERAAEEISAEAR